MVKENKLCIHNKDSSVSRIEIFTKKKKRERKFLSKNILFPIDSVFEIAPDKIELIDDYYICTVAIGKDHTGILLLDKKAIEEISVLETKPVIF